MKTQTNAMGNIYKERIKGAYFPLYPLNPYNHNPKRELKDFHYFSSLFSRDRPTREPSALYIHVPFCESFCPFCGIPKIIKKENLVQKYIQALKKEIIMYAESNYIRSSEFDALYFGGGTPTILTSEQLTDLLSYCREKFSFNKKSEITVEGCTHNFDGEKLETILQHGANRVSFGVQTFKDTIRVLLNFKDDAEKALRTVKTAYDVGYSNVDIDLMYNLPEQTVEDVERDIQTAIDIGLENISFYPLHVEPATKLEKQIKSGELHIGNKDREVAMHLNAVTMLEDAGYVQQSIISKFTLPNRECVYERLRVGSYDCLALGPSGNGNLGNYVYTNTSSTVSYIDMIERGRYPIAEGVKLSANDEMRRYMAKELALCKVDKKEFRHRFGVWPEHAFSQIIEKLSGSGLITVDDEQVKLTPMGRLWGQNVCVDFCSKEWRENLMMGN
ncbi:MAG: coproporphyrinogen-III oxidase family protein [Candidatus Bathyarchaeota archaeon]